MESTIILAAYLSGVILCLCLGIYTLKQEGGQIKDLFTIIILSLFSWITLISMTIAYVIDKISNSDFWNKEIFK